MSKDLRVSDLFDFYRNILTKNQAEAVDLYYNEDLSLGEIGENLGMTRQGVRNNLKRAEEKMAQMEQKLGLYRRYGDVQCVLREIHDEIAAIDGIAPEKTAKIKRLLSVMEE